VGLLADFFVATPDQALHYANQADEPDDGEEIHALLQPVEYKGFTSLELGTLWAILADVPWNAKTHMVEDTFYGEEGESWLNRFPDELTSLLAAASPDLLAKVCATWAATEELACDPQHISPVLADLQVLAKRAISESKSVHLWGCL